MVGGELPSADDWTLSLLTNPEVLEVDQHSTGNHPVLTTEKTVVWIANSASGKGRYLAVFNISASEATLRYDWKDLEFKENIYKIRNLWERKDLSAAPALSVTLPPHGSALYRLTPASDDK
jgi:alpha-galactosidase